jgi:hypothetical protein
MRVSHTEAPSSSVTWLTAKRLVAVAVFSCLSGALLSGCAASQADPASNNLRVFFLLSAGDRAVLRPDYEYLRLHLPWQTALMVLGYMVPNPDGSSSSVWYSAGAEFIQLSNGRIVTTGGLRTDWASVRYSALPSWQQAATAPQTYTRTRDQMPGYHFGIQETLQLRAIAPLMSTQLKNLDPTRLQWFEESIVQTSVGTESSLPPNRYAVQLGINTATVVYAEQCLSTDLCFSWQRWPAQS